MTLLKNKKNVFDEFWDSAKENNLAFNFFYNRINEIAISRFEWKNLPLEIDEVYMETFLNSQGRVLFFKDEIAEQYVCLPFTNIGMLDKYNRPINRRAYASNGYQFRGNKSDSVIIYNNAIRTDTTELIRFYAYRLWDIQRTIDVNLFNQKIPYIIFGKENIRLTLKNLMMKVKGNEPIVYANDKLATALETPVTKIDLKVDFISKELQEMKEKTWNEMLTALGIPNVNDSKRERLISDEVNRGMGGALACGYSPLEQRKRACEQINKMFDLNIEVNYREELSKMLSMPSREEINNE